MVRDKNLYTGRRGQKFTLGGIPYSTAHCQACSYLQGNGDLLDQNKSDNGQWHRVSLRVYGSFTEILHAME